jgi:hypothetical protein
MNSNNQFLKLQTTLTEWLAKNKQTSPADIRIGLWGTSGSGKTTYLAMLYYALLLSKDWEVTADTEARQFVTKHIKHIEKGNFPPATETAPDLNIFTYTLRPQSSKGTGPKIVLNFIDAPGEFYEDILSTKVQIVEPQSQRTNAGMQVNQNQGNSKGIVDYLLSCDGIIFLLDPMRSKKEGNSYWTLLLDLFLEFQERSRQEEMKTERLQQYMAFCVTKVDKEEIWSQGKPSADLAKDVMGWKLFKSLETSFCLKNRYEFFSVASIGRYLDPDRKSKESVIYPANIPDSSNTSEPQPPQPPPQDVYSGGYDPDAPSGTANTPPSSSSSSTGGGGFASGNNTPSTPEPPPRSKPTIKTDVEYEPFYVIEPIKWLIKSIQK